MESDTDEYITFYIENGTKLIRDYRLPKESDFSYWGTDLDTYFYKSIDYLGQTKPPYWTKGDFNGDGIIDRAYLLFNNKNNSVELFVFVSIKNEYRIMNLSSANKNMGVSTVILDTDGMMKHALKLFEFEGHAILYLWDTTSNNFQKMSWQFWKEQQAQSLN